MGAGAGPNTYRIFVGAVAGLAALVLVITQLVVDDRGRAEGPTGQPIQEEPADPYAFDDEEVAAAIAEAEATDPSEIRSGPDPIASDAIAAELDAAGIDLTGVRVSVWPLTGDGRTLLILNVTDDTALLAESAGPAESAPVEAVLRALVDGTAARDAEIARFAIRYTGDVEGDPVEVVWTLAMSDIEEGLRTGVPIADRSLVQVTRGPGA